MVTLGSIDRVLSLDPVQRRQAAAAINRVKDTDNFDLRDFNLARPFLDQKTSDSVRGSLVDRLLSKDQQKTFGVETFGENVGKAQNLSIEVKDIKLKLENPNEISDSIRQSLQPEIEKLSDQIEANMRRLGELINSRQLGPNPSDFIKS